MMKSPASDVWPVTIVWIPGAPVAFERWQCAGCTYSGCTLYAAAPYIVKSPLIPNADTGA